MIDIPLIIQSVLGYSDTPYDMTKKAVEKVTDYTAAEFTEFVEVHRAAPGPWEDSRPEIGNFYVLYIERLRLLDWKSNSCTFTRR